MGLHWRPVWREVSSYAVAILIVGAVVGVVYLNRHPESEFFDLVADWPVVGWVVEKLRPPAAPTPAGLSPEMTPQAERVVEVEYRGARPWVFVVEGAVLRASPEQAGAALRTLDGMTNFAVEERREEWIQIDDRGRLAWVAVEEIYDPSVEVDRRPRPVLPLPGSPPDTDQVLRALASFSGTPQEQALGGYRLYSDVSAEPLAEVCGSRVDALESTFSALFGVTPVGSAEEVIFLFAKEVDYGSFRAWKGPSAAGHASRGLAATFVGDRSPAEICETVLHELGHVITRRAIGPALPPWLTEGIGEVVERQLLGLTAPVSDARLALSRNNLPEFQFLLDADYAVFHGSQDRRLHYLTSGLLVQYLLEDPVTRGRFRAFLAYLAEGGPWATDLGPEDFPEIRESGTLADDLIHFLETDMGRLQAGFRLWLLAP